MAGRTDLISAVLVTRGNVPMEPIIESLPFDDIVIWDNSERDDLFVYGRYAAIAEAKHDIIYVQDDDVILPPESLDLLIAAYATGIITANMPERFLPYYTDSCLVGFGSVFDRELPGNAFGRFGSKSIVRYENRFKRACDVVFTAMTPFKSLDLPYTQLSYATGSDRMYQQPGHSKERADMLEEARSCKWRGTKCQT